MNLNYFITLLAAVAIGGILTVTVAYFLVKNDIQNYFRFKAAERNKESKATLLPLRLQAHERIVIFVDRINPTNLLVRLHQKGIEIGALQTILINEINAEYQHNVTQQLFVSAITWNVVKKLKDDTVAMVNTVVKNLPVDAPGIELSKRVLQHMSEIEENPYELTINLIRADIQQLF